jgi:type IV secretory pathway VirB9-like protein
MTKHKRLVSFLAIALCGSLTAEQASTTKHGHPSTATHAKPSDTPSGGVSPDMEPHARVVRYGERDIVKLRARLRFTTLLVLPRNERILDFTCGDKEYWVINGNQNLAYIKPAKAGAQTNLNLITESGNIYSFVLTEVSEWPGTLPDFKVYVEPKDESLVSAAGAAPKFVSAQEVDDYRQQVAMAQEETRRVKESAQAAIDRGISQFVTNVRFPYRFEAGKKPFYVRAMYNDERFTYIQARPEETPTLYEVKDGKPNLIEFEYKNGVYVVPKILDQGYLTIGKQKLRFTKEE